MNQEPLNIGASLEEIKSRISGIQEKPLEQHSTEFEDIYQELNRSLNEISGL